MGFAFILSRGDITHFLSQVDWEVTYTQYNSCYLVYVFEFGQTHTVVEPLPQSRYRMVPSSRKIPSAVIPPFTPSPQDLLPVATVFA